MKRIETLLANNLLYARRHRRAGKTWLVRKVTVRAQQVVRSSQFFLFMLCTSLLQAQPPGREQLTGTWVGVHAEWDVDFFCPLPTYLQLDADGAYQLGMVDGSAQPLVSTWAVQGDSVRLDTIHYAPRMVRLQGDLLRIGTLYPMVFRRFNPTPADSAHIYQQLTGRVWQSDNLTISLYANGQVDLENTATKKKTAHFWKVVRFGSSAFLVIRGNQHSKDGDFKPLWQIANVRSDQMRAIGWNGCAVTTETFRFIRTIPPDAVCHPSEFQPCSNCFSQLWQTRSISNLSKQYDLMQLIRNHYQPVPQVGQSGLVRVRFVVNCEGEQGPFDLSGFDEDYCPKLFDRRITDQLRDLCQNRVGTDATLRQSKSPNSPNDLSMVVTFRLKDGRITDILP